MSEDVTAAVPRVFISSTSEDLPAYRAAARDAVVGAEMLPKMMEYFAASAANPPLEECLGQVSAADVVVAIVGHRYGWVPPDQANRQPKSITWLECEQAATNGKEVLAFLADETYPWPEDLREESRITAAIRQAEATPELLAEVQRNVAQLKAFKDWLNSRGIRVTFTTPEDLSGKVTSALYQWRARHSATTSVTELAAKPPADATRYLRDLLAATSHIDIRGLQVGTGRAYRFPIEDLFISLTTNIATRSPPLGERDEPSEDAEQAAGSMERESRDVPLHQALARTPLVIIGDPGAGKTTFLRRVVHALCQTRLGEVPNAAEARLGIADRTFPIFVRLSELAEHISQAHGQGGSPATADAAAWLPHFLAANCQDNNAGPDEAFFQVQLENGGCTVLLDGLDEAPDRIARGSLSKLIEKATRAYRDCRFVVTSRPAAYVEEAVLPDFAHARIEPLSDQAVETFLSRWCDALYAESLAEAQTHCAELTQALHLQPEIRRLARNPVMLTALAVVHWNERRLPEQRADLYDSIVKWLSRSREQRRGRQTAERTLALLQELALAMQNHPQGRQLQVSRRWAAEAIAPELEGGAVSRHGIKRAEQFLEDEEVDSGIIVGRGHDVRFWHLTFQEFLAAKAIAGRLDSQLHDLLWKKPKKLYLPEWREVILLLAGILHQQGRARVDGFFRSVLDDLGKKAKLPDQARCAGLLGAVLRDLAAVGYRPSDARYELLLDTVMAIFDRRRSTTVPVETRIAAADALGQAGDPRLEPTNPDRSVAIPASTFWMGAQKSDASQPNYDTDAYSDESPVHEVRLDAYQLGRYPVSVDEYRRFVEHGGYREQQWWSAGGLEQFKEPEDWSDQLEYPNRPVVGVSWYEAAAFCAWAGGRLPTEAEWERAARGAKGRKFPWGKESAETSRLNFASNVGHPTPVGIYPIGATPEGIEDMAGNVLEWCWDWHGGYPVDPQDNPKGPETGEYRVLRGGSWDYVEQYCRAAYRYRSAPEDRNSYVGFRMLFSRQDS